ncbi:MAG: LytR C-terminal domain-containing protein [Candidatus Marinimicrobia bacterium]|nr:LytR C-terminal domain-containing protein [Candidatus Neomarinimicrobiota bacterium]
MARSIRSKRTLATQRSTFISTRRPWSKRRREFQHWLFNLTLGVMALLVVGFIISALTTRSGVEVTLTREDLADRARLLTAPAVNVAGKVSGPADDVAEDRIELEVLNGIGVSGLANQFTDYLRAQGYDVIRYTNAQRYDYPRTLVINRGADFAHAQQVARSLGLETSAVENMPDPSLQLDVTVVLGHDYVTLTSYREMMSSGR